MELDFSNDIIEKLLLKRALADKHWLSIVSNVYDSLFQKAKNKDNKTIFNDQIVSYVFYVALKYFKKHNSCPTMQIVQLLAKKFNEVHPSHAIDLSQINQTLTEISNMRYSIDESVLTMNFKEFIRKQALYETLSENADLLTSGSNDCQKVVDKCLENFDKVQKITFDDTDLGMNYFDPAAMKDHWDFIRNPEAKISTGWRQLDSYTSGGFLKDGRMLGLIMAQAGLGKSVFLSNLAVNFLKQNLSVVVISLEMSENVYAQRFDAHISNKNINRLKDSEDIAMSRIAEFYQKYPNARLFIKEYPPRSVKTNDIEQYLENLKNAGHHIDVIIIDYLNLVLPNHVSDSMYKDGLSVSEELRALSYRFNAPVISAVQCNSSGMNSETIDMQNVSESRGIVHTADFLAALMQTSQEDKENGVITMRLLKNRLGGQVGKLCFFSMDQQTLTVSSHDSKEDCCAHTTEDFILDDELKCVNNIQQSLSSHVEEIRNDDLVNI